MKGLLIDDDELYVRTLQRGLARKGLSETEVALDAGHALALAATWQPDFVLLDLKLGRDSGLSLIGPLRTLCPQARILLLTGYASVATAVEAIKRGADDYLPKPASVAMIMKTLRADTIENTTDDVTEAALELPTPAAMSPLHRLDWEHIQQAMQETDGNISAAARLLGMHRRTLQRKLFKRPAGRSSAGLKQEDR